MAEIKLNYCPNCGHKLIKKDIGDEGFMAFCNTCKMPIFDMFYVTTITMVVNEYDEICLLKQNYISLEHYVFVSGYLKKNEQLETSIKREVKEEIGLDVLHVDYYLSNYHEPSNQLRLGFVAYVNKQAFHKSEKEVDEVMWVHKNEAIKYLKPSGFSTQIYLTYLKKTSI